MSFIFPGFLFALAAVSIPVIIHLFNFRRFKKVYFSNVRMLQNIEQQTSSSKNLQRWLILIARVFTVIFLVLAFAKPFIPASTQKKVSGEDAISIYIDNSYSMEAVNRDGTLLDEAKRRAKEIASAYGLNARFQVLTNDFEGRHQRFLSNEELITAIDEIKVSGAHKMLQEIIHRQQDALGKRLNSRKDIYLISDFQKNMLTPGALRPDSSVSLRFVSLHANSLPNISIDSVWFVSPVHKPGEKEQLVVNLKNNSEKEAENIPLKLEINGVQKAIGSISVAARSTTSDTLNFSGLQAGWQRARVAITDYPVTFDDQFYLSFYVRSSLPVLAINEHIPNTYLQAVYRSDPFFRLDNVPAGNINYSALASYPLIVLNNPDTISPGLSRELKNYVVQGGSLFVFPALKPDMGYLKGFLQNLGTDVPEAIISQETKTMSINTSDELFADVFDNVPQNMDLPVAKKYIKFSSLTKTSRQPLINFKSSESLLSRYKSGKGVIYLSAVPLDDQSSNLVRHALFVPVMYKAALMSVQAGRLFYKLGKDEIIDLPKVIMPVNQVLKIKSERYDVIPDLRQTENTTRLYIADQIKDQGFYNLEKPDSLLAVFAFNNNRSESDMSFATQSELKAQFPDMPAQFFNPEKTSMRNEVKAIQQGSQLWKLCLILALIFLAAEIMLIRFYQTKRPEISSI